MKTLNELSEGKRYITPSLRNVARLAREPFCASGEGTTDNYDEITVDWN